MRYMLLLYVSRDEALELAARCPTARDGTVEVRELIDISGIPGGSAATP